MNPVYPPLSYVFKTYLFVSSHTKLGFQNGHLTFSHQKPVRISVLFYACNMPLQSHPPWCDHPKNIRRKIQITKLFVMQFFSSLRLLPSTYIQILFSAPCSRTACTILNDYFNTTITISVTLLHNQTNGPLDSIGPIGQHVLSPRVYWIIGALDIQFTLNNLHVCFICLVSTHKEELELLPK
jgi:hypothetical protein